MPYPGVSNQISREMDSGIRCIFAVLQRESGFEVRGVTGTAAAFRDIHHSLPLRPPALEDQGSRVDYRALASFEPASSIRNKPRMISDQIHFDVVTKSAQQLALLGRFPSLLDML
jgi:hypothetical protein